MQYLPPRLHICARRCLRTADMQSTIPQNSSRQAITASMPLPLGGLMSDKDADTVARELAVMNEAALALGCDVAAPFMALSFISLPTVPELGLTDMGLIDVLGHTLIDVEAD